MSCEGKLLALFLSTIIYFYTKQLPSLASVCVQGKTVSEMRQQQEIMSPCGVKLVSKTDTKLFGSFQMMQT